MKHVFLETNWIVGVLAPAWFHDASASALLRRHFEGEIKIHVPVVAIHEARTVLPKFKPNRVRELDGLSNWIIQEKPALSSDLESLKGSGRSVLQTFEAKWRQLLRDLCESLGGSIFPYREAAMEMQLELDKVHVQLKPFDQAILCSVVSEARLSKESDPDEEFLFCTLDSHLNSAECKEFAQTHGITVLRSFEV